MKNRIVHAKGIDQLAGFTIIELMISIAVTSIILIAVFNLFVSNSLSYNLQQSVSSIQEEGRYASQAISQSVMLAGYSENNFTQPMLRFKGAPGANSISVKRGDPDAAGNSSQAEQYASNGTGANQAFDQIVVLIESGENCTGADAWPTSTPNHWKYFYVNQKRQLICQDSADNKEIITAGVESFQIQYGIDTNLAGEIGYKQPDTYVNTPEADHRVVAIRFALVLKSRDITKAPQQYPANYTLKVLDHTLKNGTGTNAVAFSDGHLRRLFFSTIKLRNSKSGDI